MSSSHSHGSYKQIVRSTLITGGASVTNILLSIVRTKVLEERQMLGREALVVFAGGILTEMQKKGAYNFETAASSTPKAAAPAEQSAA